MGDFRMEQNGLLLQRQYPVYLNSCQGDTIRHPGDGLLPSKHANFELAHNAVDVESFLRGTGTCNLVAPQQPPVAQLKILPSQNIFIKDSVLMPTPMVIHGNQRPNLG